MAASMKLAGRLWKRGIFSKLSPHAHPAVGLCQYATQAKAQEDNEVEYPAVKPKYPPGKWGDIMPHYCWHLYNKGLELNQIPKLKDRMEAIAAQPKHMYEVNCLDVKPALLAYKQYITKTHIVSENSLPDIYEAECHAEVEQFLPQITEIITDLILQEHEYHFKYSNENIRLFQTKSTESRECMAQSLLAQILNSIQTFLLRERGYLQRSQIDEDVRVETFWRKLYEDNVKIKDIVQHYDKSVMFQLKHNAAFQLRTEEPLPQFVSVNDEVSTGNYTKYEYNPRLFGQTLIRQKPTSISGHWVNDPCEFVHLGVHVPDHNYDKFIDKYGENVAHNEFLNYALTASFGSTVAQAHNQGFNMYWDITYPFTTQTIVTDGRMFRFVAYQLNTLHMWQNDSANPLRNLLWTTDNLRLYDTLENGQVKGLNEEVIKNLMRFFLLKPRDRGVELRPYLPEERSPVNNNLLINHIGDEPLPFDKPGRFQYPKDAVYH